MKNPSFQIYRLWYFLVGAILITLLLKNYASHPGMILGWVSLITGGTLLYEVIQGSKDARLAGIILIVFIELVAVIILNTDNDPLEIWLGVVYGILSTALIGLRVLEKLRGFYR
jgi:hypothetical protein